MSNAPEQSGSEEPRGLTPTQVFGSAMASAFGVQSRRNRERDFSRGKASHFILAGFAFAALFVLGMVLLVNVIVSHAN